jgi:hypothetical protein
MSAATNSYESQARLWLVAFGVSALVNLVGLSAISFWVLAKIALESVPRERVTGGDAVATIVPEMITRAEESAPAPAAEPVPPPPPPPPPSQYARTSVDQEEVAPERPDFIGERNTRATSDDMPAAEAKVQISQKGNDPLHEDEIETTRSKYQDGDLAHDRIKRDKSEPEMPTPPPAPATVSNAVNAEATPNLDGTSDAVAPPAEETREQLAEGPVPVERRVKEAKPEDETKKGAPDRQSDAQNPQQKSIAQLPKPAPDPNAPGFRGNQSKTKLVGSITRTGRSALNVEDSARGRYHAAVGRAVEKEWQLNCVRNRDYITPGMLTMSFMIDAKGKVREIRVVEALQVGAIPKGFTLNAINHAEIPAMPADLKKQLNGEPLELLYRFSF